MGARCQPQKAPKLSVLPENADKGVYTLPDKVESACGARPLPEHLYQTLFATATLTICDATVTGPWIGAVHQFGLFGREILNALSCPPQPTDWIDFQLI